MNATAQRGVLIALVLFAAAVFCTGIHWGLPSRAVDAFFFPPDSEAENSTQAYRLTGVGIQRLAGDWEEGRGRGADVAQHPFTDRSAPIVLLENPAGFTVSQILQRGDPALPPLLAQQSQDWQRVQALSKDPATHAQELREAHGAYLQSGDAVQREIDRYNNDRIPNLAETIQRDSVNRSRILRRYRLYSNQPDEMITFRALGRMRPRAGDFDPRLYQYGGLWIYPVGGLLEAASFVGLFPLVHGPAYYVDHPEEFGEFYVVARLYAAAWGLLGVWAVFALLRRMTASLKLATVGALCFIVMPAVVELAHEAKPHLAGVTLILLAVLAGSNYVQSGKAKWLIAASIACGAAAGMILSALAGFIVIPAMAAAGRKGPARAIAACIAGLLIASAVYFITNPYVALHLVHGERAVLASNLGNGRAMYAMGSAAKSAINSLRLIAVGAALPLAVAGVCGLIVLAARRSGPGQAPSGIGMMLGLAALVVLVPFALFAADKSGEYARFALLIDVALAMAAVVAIGRIVRRQAIQTVIGALLVIATAVYSAAYERGFWRDASTANSRIAAAQALDHRLQSFAPEARPALGVDAEPAPYCLPPVDLFRWKLVLLPPGRARGEVDITVVPDDAFHVWDPRSTPMSWADKRFTEASALHSSPLGAAANGAAAIE